MPAVPIQIGTDSDVRTSNTNFALTVHGADARLPRDICTCPAGDLDVLATSHLRVDASHSNAHVLSSTDLTNACILGLLILISVQRKVASRNSRTTDNGQIMGATDAAVSALKGHLAAKLLRSARKESRATIAASHVAT